MLTLAINTASSKTGIAILQNNKLLAEKSWQSFNDESEKLMPAIDNLVKKSGKTFADIKRIIVVKGPGSFTGLRVGVTVANTIAYLNKCRLFGINTFEYWWRGWDDETIALLIYAGSGGVYVSLNRSDKGTLVNLDKLNQYLKNNKIKKAFGDITEEQKKVLKNIEFVQIKETFGQIIEKICKNIGKFNSVRIVEPYYIKPPAITKSKKAALKIEN